MIGIFGGTFDPVHYGHLKPAQDVQHALGLSEVRFIPNKKPPHRAAPWLLVEQRLQLLKLAIKDISGFVVDERELLRDGKSYMVDTLGSLKSEFPNDGLCLILGMDAIAGLKQWHQWENILSLCHIVVTQRPGYQWDDMPDNQWFEPYLCHNASELKREEAGRILLQSVSLVDVSASEIRQRISVKQDISDMVPEGVCKLLMKMK